MWTWGDNEHICKLYPFQTGAEVEEVREEIIRCRDCKHAVCTNGDWICLRFYRIYGDPAYVEEWRMHETRPDGFCAWAERRAQ